MVNTRSFFFIIISILLSFSAELASAADFGIGGGEQLATPSYTLEKCLGIAMQGNPDIGQKSWESEASEADSAIARSKLQPALKLSGGYLHSVDPQSIIKARRVGDPLPFEHDIFSTDLSLSYPLYTGKRLEKRAQAAKLRAGAQRQALEFTKDELSYLVTTVFYTILGQNKVIESLRFSHQTLLEHRKRVHELFVAKKAAKVDLLRTEVRIAELQQRLIKDESNLGVLYCQLVNLMGDMNLAGKIEIAGDLEISGMPENNAGAYDLALANREDYQALKLKLDAQEKTFQAARSERQPEVSLRASYGNRWPGSRNLGSEEVGEVYLMASMPIFDGGQISAGIRRENALMLAQKESLRKLALKIRLDVETAISNLKSAAAREEVSEKAVEQANESFRIEREKYELGKGSILDVLDAQNALLDTQTTHYRAKAEFKIALAAFSMATGVRQ
ncbi:MAG: hypothetical protein A2W80_03510 [Candidatus Riflebacteria bacterium GWC2_50_8]|nr:MAG: hypothetical protein A2W80_03510 [Candidatus Riflebacteria bacterium GWC2_50_8]